MRNVTIRQARPDDWKLLLKLDRVHSNALGYFPREMMADFIDRGCCLIATENGQDAGFVTWRTRLVHAPGRTSIYQAAVELDCMRSSHGTYLFLAVCARSVLAGNTSVQLWCRIELAACEFWKHQGMVAVAKRFAPTARGLPTLLFRLPLHPTAVPSLWECPPLRKPTTAGGKWARLDLPETHVQIQLLDRTPQEAMNLDRIARLFASQLPQPPLNGARL